MWRRIMEEKKKKITKEINFILIFKEIKGDFIANQVQLMCILMVIAVNFLFRTVQGNLFIWFGVEQLVPVIIFFKIINSSLNC